MFNQLRDPNGNFTLLASAIALFLLSGFSLPLLRTRAAILPLGLAAGAVACLVVWRRRGQRDKYDLRTLFDTPPPEDETPYVDAIPEGEVSAPYCGYCDECCPPGTHRCPRCRRALG